MPLIEKAYAEWNETGHEGRDGQNAYASLAGGWMQVVDAAGPRLPPRRRTTRRATRRPSRR